MTARSTFTVSFRRTRSADERQPAQGRVPRVARLLALAHRIDRMIAAREIKDMADAARHLGLTRARVTQIMNLLLLAPRIQEEILNLDLVVQGRDPVSERQMRVVVAESGWTTQLERWRKIRV